MTTSVKEYQVEVDYSSALAAFLLYKLVNKSFLFRKNEQINLKFQQIQDKIQQNVKANIIASKITIRLKYLFQRKECKVNVLKSPRNIYNNLCINEQLIQDFEWMFALKAKQLQFVDLNVHIGLQTFETALMHCNSCGTKLRRVTKNGGNICISYSEHDGPMVGISYKKECTNPNCKIIYNYGETITKQKMMRNELANLEYFQLSQFTYFKKDMFEYVQHYLLETCKGIESYVRWFNRKYRKKIEATSKHLQKMNQTLGKRMNKTKPELCKNRMNDAFYLATLQIDVEENFGDILEIPHSIKRKILINKQSRIDIHRSSQENSTGNGKISKNLNAQDMFTYFAAKYEDKLDGIDCGMLNIVPINSHGKVHPSHFITVIDGNSKNIRWLCGYPQDEMLKG